MDKNPRPSGFHISDILQLNSNEANPDVNPKPRTSLDYSVYNYNDYPARHYYSTYPHHHQILPSTLSSFESDLPFYNTTFSSAPSSYNGNIYFTSDTTNSAYSGNQMLPSGLQNRLMMNDANNNNYSKDYFYKNDILTNFYDHFQCLTTINPTIHIITPRIILHCHKTIQVPIPQVR
jgi:hypothetical protein